ncbi:MAG: S46 family peptidase [Bacteroidales bacterium]|nr:S46 family peptidase [Bacteroidales bacterium]MBN2817580.1 S46 family peptidase [Bacteroidales bacterium]
MKRFILSLSVAAILLSGSLKADEGMWLLPLIEKLNYTAMQEMGLQLTPEQIYSINNSSLKDAIVIFGGGCTGEIVSEEGLILTNHHCGNDYIQNHSLGENDYLNDGFFAKSKEDELLNPGLTVTFLKSIQDVTSEILERVNDNMPESERANIIRNYSIELGRKAIEGTHYRASVRPFYNNNQYYLFVYETYLDVRLVVAPPQSIGNFGDETDNWMWPRHTGDFSMFRVYSGPDGKPAEYSEENIPLKPKHHLPVSLKGIEKGDFTMILGYPGSTERYISSWGVKEILEITNPNRVAIREVRQAIMKEDMAADPKIANMYSTKYQRSSNYWKYSIGQNKGIKNLDVVGKKEAEEKAFSEWVNSQPKRKSEYGNVLSELEESYAERKSAQSNRQLLSEVFLRGIEIVSFSHQVLNLNKMLIDESTPAENLNREIERLRKTAHSFYSEFNLETDKKIALALMEKYAEMVLPEERPDIYKHIETRYKGNYKKFTDALYDKSVFATESGFNAFLDSPSLKVLMNDPAVKIDASVNSKNAELSEILRSVNEKLERAKRYYMKARMEMNVDKVFYPNANSTMRLTYGTVGDYSPSDAVHYKHYTTLKGIMEKENPDNFEFVVPEKLKELYEKKDYGLYAEKDYMPVCFITNNDITGGNSGSPILNGNGELIGLAFDGNWEAMSGDIIFEHDIQKTIGVDIRYVLFVIDKFGEAGNLIEEMTIVD